MENRETWSGRKMQQRIYVQTHIVRKNSLKRNIHKQIDVGIEDPQFQKREKVQREEEAKVYA